VCKTALRIIGDEMRCPYFTGCPHFAGLTIIYITEDVQLHVFIIPLPLGDNLGSLETLRMEWGVVYLFSEVDGLAGERLIFGVWSSDMQSAVNTRDTRRESSPPGGVVVVGRRVVLRLARVLSRTEGYTFWPPRLKERRERERICKNSKKKPQRF
jgi:hypothetical protein